MAIIVSCKCGKKFKVKDELAGKAIKCPQCGSPLRIPAPATAGAGVAGKGSSAVPAPKIDAEQALLRYEEAQKKKQLSAEEEAAVRAEQNKLIESYDQLAGKTAKPGEKKKKGELTEVKAKKPTIFTKIADLFGGMKGTFAFKYVVIIVLLGGGAVGSVFLVKYITGYMGEQTKPQMPKEERMHRLFDEAETLVKEKKWTEAAERLDEIIQIDPHKDMHRDYQRLRKAVQEGGG